MSAMMLALEDVGILVCTYLSVPSSRGQGQDGAGVAVEGQSPMPSPEEEMGLSEQEYFAAFQSNRALSSEEQV